MCSDFFVLIVSDAARNDSITSAISLCESEESDDVSIYIMFL